MVFANLGDKVVVWSCRGRSGYPIGLAVVPSVGLPNSEVARRLTWSVWKMLKRPTNGGAVNPATTGPGWDDISKRFPDLFYFLTLGAWDDGAPREPGAILLFCDGGQLKAMLKDKEHGRCLWVTADTLEGLFHVANLKVNDDSADWRADKQSGQTRKRK